MKKLIIIATMLVFANAGESWFDKADIEAGKKIFKQNCAVCHGDAGAGTGRDWRQKMANGKMPPPPLNGTAHTWHHSPKLLDKIIQEGGKTYGKAYEGWMPAFKDKLDEKDRLNVLKYIHSLWPKRIQKDYDEFYKIK